MSYCKDLFIDVCQGSLDPIRSFALSGLMLAVGFIKIKEQTQSLMVITAGLVSLAIVVSKDPNQDLY